MQAGIVITETQKTQLVQLVELLHKWNKAYNLTSVRDPDAMLVKHILDSLVVSPHLHGERFIDVGTGPGLPDCRWPSSIRTNSSCCSTAWASGSTSSAR